MKLNLFMKRLSTVGRFLATTLFCLLTIAFVWQGAFISDTAAIAATDAGTQVQQKVSEDTANTKGFVRDTADFVEKAASDNAAKVDKATGDDGGFVEGKAKRDAARIHQRAEEDTARTQKAIDNTKNVVERAVEGIKDALSD